MELMWSIDQFPDQFLSLATVYATRYTFTKTNLLQIFVMILSFWQRYFCQALTISFICTVSLCLWCVIAQRGLALQIFSPYFQSFWGKKKESKKTPHLNTPLKLLYTALGLCHTSGFAWNVKEVHITDSQETDLFHLIWTLPLLPLRLHLFY